MPRGVTLRRRSLAALVAVGVVTAGLSTMPTAAVADSSTLFVSNVKTANCSDTAADAGTQAQPYCTLQVAADAAQPGDTVEVSPGEGDQQGPLDITHSGTAGEPITFVGNVAFDGTGPHASVLAKSGTGAAVTFDHVDNVVVEGFQMLGQSGSPAAVAVAGSSHIALNQDVIDATGLNSNTFPAVSVDGSSSAVTLSRDDVNSSQSGSAVAVGAGATGVVVTTSELNVWTQPAFTSAGSTGTVLVSNTVGDIYDCPTVISLGGDSSGSTIENNLVETGTGQVCPAGQQSPAPSVVVSAASATGTEYDYNTIENSASYAPYSWAGRTYPTAAALLARTGQGAHDFDQVVAPQSPGTATRLEYTVDNADANAPDELSTDFIGNSRVDDPLVPNTGTGVGYDDRGAIEYQDPYRVSVGLTATKGPAPLAETITADESNPWNTPITGYTFTFSDGTAPIVSSTPTVTHTFSAITPVDEATRVSVSATTSTGVVHQGAANWVQVVAPAPLVPSLVLTGPQDGQSGLTVNADLSGTTDAWNLTDATIDFGDHSAPVDLGTAPQTTHAYPAPGTYSVKLTVRDAGGNTRTLTQQVTAGSLFTPLAPVRILDTRAGTGAREAAVGPGGVVRLHVAGVDGIPAAGVTAVTLNLTATGATASTHVSAYPDGAALPNASVLNLVRGQTEPNLVTVAVGADGSVDLYNNSGSVELIGDVEGYYSSSTVTDSTVGTGTVSTVTPTRVLDTRTGTVPFQPGPRGTTGQWLGFSLPASSYGNATAVILNLTETGATATSWIGVPPGYGAVPATSVLNFDAGQTLANQVVVPIEQGGWIGFYNHTGKADLIADVEGYVGETGPTAQQELGSVFTPIVPTRVLDTRTGNGAPQAALGAAATLPVRVGGVDGIPAGVKAVLVNLTAIAPSSTTWLSAFADGTALPGTSDLNVAAGQVRPNDVLVPVGADGSIDLYNSTGSVNVAADVQGYYM